MPATREVSARNRVDEKLLEAYLRLHVDGFCGPLQLSEFTIGTSNPTFLISTPGRRYVLRRKPAGDLLPSAHAVDREFRALSALSSSLIPVARPLTLCMDQSVIGSIFYVMDFVEGRIFTDDKLPELAAGERFAIYDAMNTTLAQLHLIDYASLGLADYGREGNYFARQIARWTKQYLATETKPIPEMKKLIELLPRRIPDNPQRTIVHGDFTLTNLIFHPTAPRVIAVLDWELSTIGDPLADFTYNLKHWYMPHSGATSDSLLGVDVGKIGIPTMAEYIGLYAGRVGRSDICEHLDFCIAYNLFRLAGLSQGTAIRAKLGNATNDSSASEDLTARLAQAAWSLASLAAM